MSTHSTSRPTMSDVARLADVSKATVSAVLNGTGAISEETRDRVLSAVARLNYRVHAAGGASPQPRTAMTLGVLIKEIDNPYYADLVLGAREVAERRGCTLLVASSEGQQASECRAVDALRTHGVDGLMLTPVLDDTADLGHLFDLKRRNVPLVLLERVRGLRASLVDVDNTRAAQRGAEHLITHGHRRIAHFAGPAYSMHSQERIEGVRRACGAAGIVLDDAQIVTTGAHLADGHRAAHEYFARRPRAERATGITCYNDLVAIGACRALRELGLRVPDDVSVIGFDDIALAAYMGVPLTTVRMPRRRMGRLAAQMLIDQIEAHRVLPPRCATLPSELVERGSVARPSRVRAKGSAEARRVAS